MFHILFYKNLNIQFFLVYNQIYLNFNIINIKILNQNTRLSHVRLSHVEKEKATATKEVYIAPSVETNILLTYI